MKDDKLLAKDTKLNMLYMAAIGDALGVPVEFSAREERDRGFPSDLFSVLTLCYTWCITDITVRRMSC